MRPWATTAAVLMVYGLGALSGWMGKARIDSHKLQAPPPSLNLPPTGQTGPFQQLVDQELDLTPEQREKVDQIFTDAQINAQRVRQTINPQLRELRLQTYLKVEAELTQEQQRKLRSSLRNLQSYRNFQKWERKESNGPTPVPRGL